MMMKLMRLLVTGCLMLLMTACMNVATTGAQAIYNQHSLRKSLSDQYISMQAYQAINVKTKEFENANISVAVYQGDVLLAGQVPQAWQKYKAEALIKKIPDVKSVYNQIEIASPSSTLTRMSDAWITTKVKSKLIVSDDVDVTKVKVVTEDGIVYLMGVLKPSEAQAATTIASQTQGVQAVVRIFSYVHISKKMA